MPAEPTKPAEPSLFARTLKHLLKQATKDRLGLCAAGHLHGTPNTTYRLEVLIQMTDHTVPLVSLVVSTDELGATHDLDIRLGSQINKFPVKYRQLDAATDELVWESRWYAPEERAGTPVIYTGE